MTKIIENIKTVFIPLTMIIVLAILFVILYVQGYKRIISYYDQYKILQKENDALSLKLEDLKKLDTSLLNKSETVIMALPSSNNSSIALSNIKNIISDNRSEVTKVNLKVNETENTEKKETEQESKEKLSYADVSIEMTSLDFQSIISIFDKIYSSLPLITIKSAEFTQEKDQVRGKITFNNYWSELPTLMPKISEPIDSLNDENLGLLNEISGYQIPQASIFDPTRDDLRINPFQN